MKTTFLSVGVRGFALIAAAGSLAACVTNPYEGVHPGYFVTGNQQLTPEVMNYQDTVSGPRCDRWADETVPEMGWAYATNGGQAGAIGGAVGQGTGLAIQGLSVDPTNVGVGAAWGAALGTAHGYVQGEQAEDQQTFAWGVWCRAADAGGYHAVPPSEGEAIRGSGQGRTYGPPLAQGRQELPPEPPSPH